jgi:4-amino-4-deoxy-L-arabinose transferase-like glycosyltransferase
VEPAAARNRAFAGWLAGITAGGLVVRLWYLVAVGRDLTMGFDAVWYQLQAGTLADGTGYVDPDAYYRLGQTVPTANFPPLWPALLAAANRLGLDTETGYQLVGVLVGTLVVALSGVLGRRVAGRRVGLGTALVVALSPALTAADSSVMSDSLYVLAVTAATTAAVRAVSSPRPAWFALLGALLGMAALARSDALVLTPVLVGVTAWAVRPAPATRRAGLGAVALGCCAVLVVPWSLYASARLDTPTLLSSNSGSLLEGANCATAYRGPLVGAWDAACLAETRRPGASEADWSADARAAGVRYAQDHAPRLALVVPVRVLRGWGLWDPRDQADLEAVESRSRRWQLGAWGFGLAVLGAAVPGAVVLARRAGRRAAPLAATVAGSTLVVAASWGNSRFVLAAVPCVAVAAAAAAVALVDRARQAPSGGASSRAPAS